MEFMLVGRVVGWEFELAAECGSVYRLAGFPFFIASSRIIDKKRRSGGVFGESHRPRPVLHR